MIVIARAEGLRTLDLGEVGAIQVPDIKLPQGVDWGTSIPEDRSYPSFHIWFEHDGQRVDTLWQGPYTVGLQTLYIVDAPKRVLQMLRNQLGAENVAPLIQALRARPALRSWAKARGFTLIRNTAGNPVGVRSPLVIAGSDGGDLGLGENETVDDLPELLDLEK